MRPTPHLGEMTIKVPAPFAGISDLGFTARYRAQHFNEPQRDVPLLFEGPEPPMRRLAEVLRQLSETQRHCLSLRAEGLRYREIAEVLDIGVSTVADCLRRAVETLRKGLCE